MYLFYINKAHLDRCAGRHAPGQGRPLLEKGNTMLTYTMQANSVSINGVFVYYISYKIDSQNVKLITKLKADGWYSSVEVGPYTVMILIKEKIVYLNS